MRDYNVHCTVVALSYYVHVYTIVCSQPATEKV